LVDGSGCFSRSDWMSNHALTAAGDGFFFNSTATKTSHDTNAEGILFYNDRKVFTAYPIAMPSGNSSATTFNYYPYIDESKSTIYFLLAGQTKTGTSSVLHGKGWDFNGTHLDDATFNMSNPFGQLMYYVPDITDFENFQYAGSTTDNNFFTAVFKFDDFDETTGTDWDTNVFVDTTTHKVVKYDPQRTLPTVGVSHRTSSSNWNLRDDDAVNYIPMGYTDYGSKFNLANQLLTITMPENRPEVVTYVKSEGSTTTSTSTGESLTVKKGETGTTTAGTTVSVDDITYTAAPSTAACTAEDITVTKAATPNNVMVYSDSETVAGTVAVIGGWKVNSYAAGLGLEDKLTKSGDWVAEKMGEKIVIAGFTKGDTAAAVQQVINWLDTQ
jgi:hypothetical protein